MKQVSIGFHVLALITVLVMQSAGSWYCLAKDSLCPVSAVGSCASQHDCCGNDSKRDESPSCCAEIAPDPQNLAAVERFQQPDPVQADLPDWEIPNSREPLAAINLSRRYLVGGDPPPGHAALAACLCVRRI